MGGGGWDADAGPELEVGGLGECEDPCCRDDGVLLGGAARRPTVTGEGDPDAVADVEFGDARAELVDHAGAVVVWHRRFDDRTAGCAAARLPVGRGHVRGELSMMLEEEAVG